ncbi:hypothetical protein C8Q76DRAFT_476440 [Earliella scabrosa]|nr:hypothetical protein C8Q76DRAFT_476440 [Earliella scabrosa]
MSLSSPPSSSQCVYDVPMALDRLLTHTRGLEPECAKANNIRVVREARNYTLGPMPVRDFINNFLDPPSSGSTKNMRSSRHAFHSVPSCAATSAEIYGPLVVALNESTKWKARCPGFSFVTTQSVSPRKLGYMKPDICCYSADQVATVEAAGASARADFGYAELFFEVKPSPSHDFFVDPRDGEAEEHDFFAKSQDERFEVRRSRALGQHILYVTEILARQHRLFFFSVSMSGSSARLLRWDRAGCVVSASFDIRQEPGLLCEFLWRFSQTSDAGRGHDPTVAVAAQEEDALFRGAIRDYLSLQLDVQGEALDQALTEHYQHGHVAAIHVYPQNQPTARRFIVSRPVVSPLYLTGRGTRGYWALDVDTREVVFLKDTWRSSLQNEGDVIQQLQERGVRNIPSLVCHGDVPQLIADGSAGDKPDAQCSLTDAYCAQEPGSMGGRAVMSKQRHYRIVLGTVGYDLQHLRGTDELLHATYDVFQAIIDAYTLGKRLHRDVSVGNIILVRDGSRSTRKGYLIDWDASCEVDDSGASTEAKRVGTWLFMSRQVLSHEGPTRKHTLQDDMESLLYVILYCSFLWLPHNLSKYELGYTIRGLFEETSRAHGIIIGGGGKIINAMLRRFTGRVEFNEPLKEWLTTVMNYLSPAKTQHSYAGVGHKWSSPEPLYQYWTDFLQTRTLPQNDRVVHDNPHATGKEEPVGSDASTEAISLGKRPSEERDELDDDDDDDDDVPTSKKPRSHTPVASPPPQLLRRSQRARVPRNPAPVPLEQPKRPVTKKQSASRKQPTPRKQPSSRKQADPREQPVQRKPRTQTKTISRHVRR